MSANELFSHDLRQHDKGGVYRTARVGRASFAAVSRRLMGEASAPQTIVESIRANRCAITSDLSESRPRFLPIRIERVQLAVDLKFNYGKYELLAL